MTTNIVFRSMRSEDNETVVQEASLITTHYVFLVHGYLGNDLEMKYIECAIEKSFNTYNIQSLTGDRNRLVTHRPTHNVGKTTDGIEKGGIRLAKEIEEFIRKDTVEQLKSDEVNTMSERHISVSFVGNSLGGLYSRYAIALLPEILEADGITLHTKVVIHRNVFCTTATPHLGCASNTFLPIPRFAEKFVGSILSKTGSNLFRCDVKDGAPDLIYEMSTNYDKFLLPLSKFQKRLCYANTFKTDFQVPTNTAAFLSKKSSSPHHPIDLSSFGNCDAGINDDETPCFIVAAFTTEKNDSILKRTDEHEEDKISIMSNKLDALGWTKIFIDLRDKIPTLTGLNRASSIKERKAWDEFLKEKLAKSQSYDDIIVTSQELVRIMNESKKAVVPTAHVMLAANSKNEKYCKKTEHGKPVMDKMANDLVHDIFNLREVAILNKLQYDDS